MPGDGGPEEAKKVLAEPLAEDTAVIKAAEAKTIVAEKLADGEELVTSARLRAHANKPNYETWERDRRLWVAATRKALSSVYPTSDEARAFDRAATSKVFIGPRPWMFRAPRELKATEAGVSTLETLAAELPHASFAPSPLTGALVGDPHKPDEPWWRSKEMKITVVGGIIVTVVALLLTKVI